MNAYFVKYSKYYFCVSVPLWLLNKLMADRFFVLRPFGRLKAGFRPSSFRGYI
jgi:hypothetical protein